MSEKIYNFLDFTKERYPEIWEEFDRYKRKNILPAIGSKVKTLVSGYGGAGNDIRYVVSHSDKYIGLSDIRNGKEMYACEIESWWKELSIIKEPNK